MDNLFLSSVCGGGDRLQDFKEKPPRHLTRSINSGTKDSILPNSDIQMGGTMNVKRTVNKVQGY
jgi:hypothetical protein